MGLISFALGGSITPMIYVKAWWICLDHHHLSTWESSVHRAALAGDQGLDPDYEPDLDWFKSPRKSQEERASHPHEYVSGDGYPYPDGYDPSQTWYAIEIYLEGGRILVLDYTR